MAEIEKLISLYHNIYLICLVLAIAFLVLTIFLFVFLDIKNVFMSLTGRAEKKAIKQMEEHSVFTSQLSRQRKNRYAGKMISPSGQLGTPSGGKQRLVEPEKVQTNIPLVQPPEREESKTEALVNPYEQNYTPKADTTILNEEITTVSAMGKVSDMDIPLHRANESQFNLADVGFMLERQIMMIHTQESIIGKEG